MVVALSTPILSVVPDAIRDLQGHDALVGLWAIFTKCKGSLPDGARLENITWRLWHRELRGQALEKTVNPRESPPASELEEVSYRPPTPSSSIRALSADPTHDAFSEGRSVPSYSLSPLPCCPRRSLSENATRRSFTRVSPVGKLISDFLLSSTVRHPPHSRSGFDGAATIYHSSAQTPLVGCDATRPSTIKLPEPQSLASLLPTPDTEVGDLGPTMVAKPPLLNVTTEGTSVLLPVPPRLVVVNPTPNLTPQATPPTTPLVTRPYWLTPLPSSRRGHEGKTVVGDSGIGTRSNPSCGPAIALLQHDAVGFSTDRDQDDERSASSIASRSSGFSQTTTTSLAEASITSASSTGYGQVEGVKESGRIGTTIGYSYFVENLPLKKLGSLSTIQSISTDRRKETIGSCDFGDAAKVGRIGVVTAAEESKEDAEQEIFKKEKLAAGSRDTSKTPARRDSAPVSLTTNLASRSASHVDQVPHQSPAVPHSTELPTNPESTTTNSNLNMTREEGNDRSSSQSCSRERSSMKGSQSRSRERSGNRFADLSGIGTLGGYTIAAAYPPPNMTVRKQVVVGAGKGKVKVAFGRGGKSKVVRRNSAGSSVDVSGKDKGGNQGNNSMLENVKSVEHQPSPLEDILEKPTLCQIDQQPKVLPLIHETIPQNSASNDVPKHPKSAETDALPNQPAETLSKGNSTPTLDSLDPVLAAKVRDSLGEPLLPKGRPVVVDSDSEYETDTEDGSWSDEEVIDKNEKQDQAKRQLALQREQESREAERQQKDQIVHQMCLPEQQNHNVGRPTGVQRTQSSHYPAPNHARTNKGAFQRNRHQQIRELALQQARLEEAAKEAQRQRDMIKKLPRESFQDLAKARANSVGLLSQLLNPNPEGLPPNHPYTRGNSSGEIQPAGLAPMAPIEPTTSGPVNPNAVDEPTLNHDSQQPTLTPQTEASRPRPRRHMSTDEGKRRMVSLSKVTSPIRGPPLQLTKSAAAVPVSSQVQVGSVNTPLAALTSSGAKGHNVPMTGSGVYRPKGPPKDQEMEEDSGSEPEAGKIQMPKSIAEQKLKALVQKRGIRRNQAIAKAATAGPSQKTPQGDNDQSVWAPSELRQEDQPSRVTGLQIPPVSRPPPSVPIPLGHQYNLPPPAAPTTPRTTRRQMLSTELSESLRRNLLWERQVSKSNLAAMRRSSSGVANRHDGQGRLQPFTSIAPVVRLHAKGTIPLEQQDDPAKRALVPLTEAEREEMRRHAIARNRSWANEFHFAGW